MASPAHAQTAGLGGDIVGHSQGRAVTSIHGDVARRDGAHEVVR